MISFINTFLAITTAISQGYFGIAFFMTPNLKEQLNRIPLILSLLVFCSFYFCYLISMATMSQSVTDKVSDLKEILIGIKSNGSLLTEKVDAKTLQYSIEDAAKILDRFQGFDCGGFFTLGKPLLTSITATFATYFIILVQFKLSGPS